MSAVEVRPLKCPASLLLALWVARLRPAYTSAMADPLPKTPTAPREPRRPLDLADFPGCRAVHLPVEELDDYEGHIDYWEARTETAMILAEPATLYHDVPSAGVAGLVEMITQARGTEILALGSVDLVQRGERGDVEILMQADALFFLDRPWPTGRDIDVDRGPLPDVVVEVDHTTDVRRRKLEVYASMGFPEVWVEVPEPTWLAPRASGRPRLTIYLLEGDRYVESAVSRAFAGWRASEIHRALNEERRSAETVAAVRRVGRRLGRAVGTGPDDDLFLGAERAESRLEMVRSLVREALQARGFGITPVVEAWLERLPATTDPTAAIRAAVECRDAEDFLRRMEALAAGPNAPP